MILIRFRSCNECVRSILIGLYCEERSKQFLNVNFIFDIHE